MQQQTELPPVDGATDVVLALAIGGAISIATNATVPALIAVSPLAPMIALVGCMTLIARHIPQMCNPLATGAWLVGRAIGDPRPMVIAPNGLFASMLPALADAFSQERADAVWLGRQALPAPTEAQTERRATIPPSNATPFRTSRNGTAEALTDICTQATHLGIIGASGAGKSTLLEVLTLQWANAGVQVIVIDPHAGPTKWHGASQVVGNSPEGPNFDEIDGILDSVIARINERLGMIYGGHEEDAFPRIAIICDEWRDIAFNVPNAGDKLARILSTARKVSLKMVVGTQSKNVRALFGDGKGDGSIRDCLTLLNLTQEKVSKARYALLDGERYDLPPPVPAGMFPQTPRSHSSKPENEQSFPLARPTEREPEEDGPLDDIDPDKRTMILMLYQSGWTRDKIANVALKGTRRSDALKTIRLVLEHQ